MDFYKRVSMLLKKQKKTLVAFMSEINVNYESYRSTKRGGHIPRADDALKIAKGLKVSLEYLLTGSTSNMQEINILVLDDELQEVERRVKLIRDALKSLSQKSVEEIELLEQETDDEDVE